jgi:phage recombination protein Bet
MSTTALATQNTSIKTHAPDERYFTEDQMKLLSDHIMKGATPVELQYFGEVCKRVGLDPFKKQIHAVQRWDNTAKRMVWSYQTGIDGYIAIAHRNGLCAGIEDIQFLPPDESTPNPVKATCTVWKIVGGQRMPFTASARWTEYVQLTKEGNPNSMWRKMPYGQLGKCARALAIRMAFPEEIGGILTDVEMEQTDSEAEHSGPKPAGRSAHFDMESRPFEAATEQQEPEKPSVASKQGKPSPEPVEAELVPMLAVPGPVAEWIHGKWKTALGDIKGKALETKRDEAFTQDDHTPIAQACASIYDEVQARLTAKKISETDLADIVCANGIQGIEFPGDLWMVPSAYGTILNIAKSIK